MGEKTGISWTGSTWNYIRGCSREIADDAETSGCGDGTGGGCYAERDGGRFCGPGGAYEGLVRLTAKGYRWTGEVRVIAHKLLDPIRWTKPRKIFVASVSDPFHPKLSNELIAAAFGVMAIARRHTFQLLTKRARRMRAWFSWVAGAAATAGKAIVQFCIDLLRALVAELIPDEGGILERAIAKNGAASLDWPLSNLWLGVSTEHQPAANERIPELLSCPAHVHMISVEPMIGELSLRSIPVIAPAGADSSTCRHGMWQLDALRGVLFCPFCGVYEQQPYAALRWVIIGCESGPGSRVADVAWIRSLVAECEQADVARWLKQAVLTSSAIAVGPGSKIKRWGVVERPYLDGAQQLEFPE